MGTYGRSLTQLMALIDLASNLSRIDETQVGPAVGRSWTYLSRLSSVKFREFFVKVNGD